VIRLWLSRRTATSVHDQLTSQLILGILSERLEPGERLPSIRSLARRLQLHPNTVSAVYRSLATGGWVTQRPGSGVFVRDSRRTETNEGVDAFAKSYLEEGLARGHSSEDLFRSAQNWLKQPHGRFLVVDPDRELARILAAEISEALGRTVPFAGYEESNPLPDGTACVLITGRFAKTDPEGLRTRSRRTIQLKSMQDVVAHYQRPPAPILLGVVSRSNAVLRWASILVSALGFSPDAVVFRNPERPGWREGLHACHLIGADIVSAQELESKSKIVRFRIVSDEFLAELKGPAPWSRQT
jgi:DNA-binding transcriptional regulator YhcF (GntR family)